MWEFWKPNTNLEPEERLKHRVLFRFRTPRQAHYPK